MSSAPPSLVGSDDSDQSFDLKKALYPIILAEFQIDQRSYETCFFIKTFKDPHPIDNGNYLFTLLGMAMDSVCTSEVWVECQEFCYSRRSSADMNCRRMNTVKMVRKAATHNNHHNQVVRLLCSGFQIKGHALVQSDIVLCALCCVCPALLFALF